MGFERKRTYSVLSVLMVFALLFSLLPPLAYAATGEITFDFVEITDFHGYLVKDQKQSDGSVIKQQIASVLGKQMKDLKKENPNTVILSGGDMFQGTPESNVLKGKPVIDVMKNIGFDAMALGNHEYDWGLDSVIDMNQAVLKDSQIPVLAANVYDKKTGKPVQYVKPYAIIERGGVKIAVIGAVDHKEFPNIILPAYVKDVEFKDPAPIVNDLVPKLRTEGAKLVILLVHSGAYTDKNTGETSGNLIDLAKQVKGVDAIFGGHTHSVVTTKVNGVPVGVGGNYGLGYLHLQITLKSDGTVSAGDMTFVDGPPLYNTTNPVTDPEIKAIVDQAMTDVGPLFGKVIGKADVDLTRAQSAKPYGDSILGNWAADVTRNVTKADFGVANNGGLRIDVPKGEITVGTMYQLMPFDNTFVTVKMTGAQVKMMLEQAVQDGGKGIQISGLTFKYDPARPSLDRVVEMKKADGTPIDPAKTYRVGTNNFVGTGGDLFQIFKDPEVAKSYTDTYILARDAFIDAVKAQKNVTAKMENRISVGTAAPAGDAVEAPKPAPVPTPVPAPAPKPTPAPTSAEKPASAQRPAPTAITTAEKGNVAAFALNVRTGPGVKHPVSFVLHLGNEVILGETKYGWVKVTYNGKTGYAYGKYLLLPASEVKGKEGKVQAGMLNVRAAPSDSGKILGVLKKGDVVTILGEENGWYQIQFQGKMAYAYGRYLDLSISR
ncbi:5'-nucleotidase C-terminal domain-containing protein [Thermicanus aegyptius]|uniref:5'-nucleotidase C-terminal domain-containing protein n=1 Tax=Thermicanus aegyptius TaxID=94009 RepID=UPI0004118A11|nr:5'-nucleotidase C-terminal domain-containing protein [Thermicanus aegyptius]